MSFPPLHPGDPVSADHAAHIFAGLKARTLAKTEWTHGAHLVAAVALLDDIGLEGALRAMPDMIRRYNEAAGVQNSDTEGYHHTITVFYLHTVNDFVAQYRRAPVHERVSVLLGSALAARDYALGFYSKELLFSAAARRDYVPPDLNPFPGQPRSGLRARDL